MLEKLKGKKRLLIIFLIVILIPALFSVYWFVLRVPTSSEVTPSGNNLEEQEEEEVYIPSYESSDLADFSAQLLSAAKAWASDYRIHSITALTKSIEDGDERIFFGTEGGKFSSWIIEIYSPSKKASIIYSYSNGNGDFDEEMPIDDKYVVDMYNQKPYFNDLGNLKSTQEVYEVAVGKGLVTGETHHIYMYLGSGMETQIYGNRYVWRIDERSNTQFDEYGTSVVSNSFYIDGKTLAFIK
ncbi:MAG: hypothetical protein RBS01_03045 [Candidatus Dojkabacteria bacterium]|jgi:hypothetical protein|nr:hypothetical protein [Candidatus Dojkabacteria bacterium]